MYTFNDHVTPRPLFYELLKWIPNKKNDWTEKIEEFLLLLRLVEIIFFCKIRILSIKYIMYYNV